MLARVRDMVAERRRLLRLVLLAARPPLLLYGALGMVTAFAPVATSLLTGRLAEQLRREGDVGQAVWAGVGVAVSIVLLQQALAFITPLSTWVASSIDGHIREDLAEHLREPNERLCRGGCQVDQPFSEVRYVGKLEIEGPSRRENLANGALLT